MHKCWVSIWKSRYRHRGRPIRFTLYITEQDEEALVKLVLNVAFSNKACKGTYMAHMCVCAVVIIRAGLLLWEKSPVSLRGSNIFSLTWLSVTLPCIPNTAIAPSKPRSVYIYILCLFVYLYIICMSTQYLHRESVFGFCVSRAMGILPFDSCGWVTGENPKTHSCSLLIQEASQQTIWTGYGIAGITLVEYDYVLFVANLSHFLCLTWLTWVTRTQRPTSVWKDPFLWSIIHWIDLNKYKATWDCLTYETGVVKHYIQTTNTKLRHDTRVRQCNDK